MPSFSRVRVHDPLFGTVTVELDHEAGFLSVYGERTPRVELRRAEGTAVVPHVPIGTRDTGCLFMLLGGAPVPLRPGKGFLTRRSYKVDVGHGDAPYRYRLVPVSYDSSRFFRSGTPLGVLVSTGDGKVTADWKDGQPDGFDASVGYALAVAFGTGAESIWQLALDAVLDW
ncbi:hypothetical protein GCM10010302_32250 [Streptomyces polychromogenes]|uniref:Uncharacterized protein n=1 Tax=Streptomyces polychromogenes TaxID=67342 RepID=A0ABN0VE33_9ACTN